MEASSSSISERSRTRSAPDDQDSLFDKIIENDVLEQALEKREQLRAKAAKAKGDYEEARDTAKGMLDAEGIEPGSSARCGRFRIKKSRPGEPTDVAFTTSPKPRLTISLLD